MICPRTSSEQKIIVGSLNLKSSNVNVPPVRPLKMFVRPIYDIITLPSSSPVTAEPFTSEI